MDLEPGDGPDLDEFLLARLAEDKRKAGDAAAATGRGTWAADDVPAPQEPEAVEHVTRFDPDRVLADTSAKRRLVLTCRDTGPDMRFLRERAATSAQIPPVPHDQHQLAALTLALLALPYAGHRDYRPEWRP